MKTKLKAGNCPKCGGERVVNKMDGVLVGEGRNTFMCSPNPDERYLSVCIKCNAAFPYRKLS